MADPIQMLLNVGIVLGAGYITVAYLLPAIQGQTAPTQSDIDAYNEFYSGAFADPTLQTDTGLFGGIDFDNEDEVELITKLLGLDDEDEDDKKSSKKSSNDEDYSESVFDDEPLKSRFENSIRKSSSSSKASTTKPKTTKKLNSSAGRSKFYSDAAKNKTTAAQKAAVVKMFGR